MLFRPEHVEPILAGRKTQTRRRWKWPRVKVGGTYWAQTRLFEPESRFARVRVLRIWRVYDLRETTQAEAQAEGYDSCAAFLEAFRRINKWEGSLPDVGCESWPIWAVEFQVIQTGDEGEP